MKFPQTRLRRLRKNKIIRSLFEDVDISLNDFILPIFVCEGKKVKRKISSLEGHYEFSVDELIKHCHYIKKIGINSIILFGVTDKKNDNCSTPLNSDSIIPNAIRHIKKEFDDLLIIADLCNCEYTVNGQCGILKNGYVDNDETNKVLSKQALVLAEAGVDVVAPSDMMDGRVSIIRQNLDSNGFQNTLIFPYSVKYASFFYSPFRKAANINSPNIDRKTYQMNFKNSFEALREIELDIKEGADAFIIKPALSYLDIISKAKSKYNIPIIAYNVSGEYSMVAAASQNKWINRIDTIYEILISMKRAGASAIITYHALEVAEKLNSDV